MLHYPTRLRHGPYEQDGQNALLKGQALTSVKVGGHVEIKGGALAVVADELESGAAV